MRKILGLLVIVVLLGSTLTGIGLLNDKWTAERSAQTDERIESIRQMFAAHGVETPERRATNEEMNGARLICAVWALLVVPWCMIQYQRGRKSG